MKIMNNSIVVNVDVLRSQTNYLNINNSYYVYCKHKMCCQSKCSLCCDI